jgi:hypothetical protein
VSTALPRLRPSLLEPFRRVLRENARMGRPVFVVLAGKQRGEWVLLKKSLEIKELLGLTFEVAQRTNPIAMARLLAPSTRELNKASEHELLEPSLSAFWSLADRWKLTEGEQCALLAISARTLVRWNTKPPIKDAVTLDRLRIVFLTYRRILECTGGLNANNIWMLRKPGSAGNPESPSESILEALSERSVLTMLEHYRRVEAMIHGR